MTTFADKLYEHGGKPVGIPEIGARSVRNKDIVYFVDANNGSDHSDGESWKTAKATIQAAVTLANSPRHALDNVDIFVANGNYEETVLITRAGTELTDAAMLWQNMGSNCGYIGTLRIIGGGGVVGAGLPKWTCGTTALDPPLYIGRPNVEIHGFNIQNNETGGVAAGLWSLTTESGGHPQIGMPCIHVQDQYNYNHDGVGGGALLNGAGNNVLIKNCRINSGGVLHSGGKWVNVEDCLIEYGTHGVAMIANSKGKASESHVNRTQFSQLTYDITHGEAICCWVDGCRFSTVSTRHIFPLAAHTASTLCVVMNSCGQTEAIWGTSQAKNNGWEVLNCHTTDTGAVNSADLNAGLHSTA